MMTGNYTFQMNNSRMEASAFALEQPSTFISGKFQGLKIRGMSLCPLLVLLCLVNMCVSLGTCSVSEVLAART